MLETIVSFIAFVIFMVWRILMILYLISWHQDIFLWCIPWLFELLHVDVLLVCIHLFEVLMGWNSAINWEIEAIVCYLVHVILNKNCGKITQYRLDNIWRVIWRSHVNEIVFLSAYSPSMLLFYFIFIEPLSKLKQHENSS